MPTNPPDTNHGEGFGSENGKQRDRSDISNEGEESSKSRSTHRTGRS